VTSVTCMNATITYVPLLLVFPMRNMKAELLESAPTGSEAACHKTGWIQIQSFMQWFKHFIRFVKMSKNDPATDTGWSLFSFKEQRGDRLCSVKRGAHFPSPSEHS